MCQKGKLISLIERLTFEVNPFGDKKSKEKNSLN